jgi:hypothetical protein
LIRPILAAVAALLVFAAPASALTVKWTALTNDPVLELTGETQYECRVDDQPFAACTSPWRPAVGDGRHSFDVRSGMLWQTGAFTVDRTGPVIAFTAEPAQTGRSVAYALTVSDGTPECTWDGAPVACGETLDGVADGAHVLVVRAADALGNATEVTRTVVVATPQVTHVDPKPAETPQGGVLSTSATSPSVRVVTAKRTRAWTQLKSVVVRDAPKGTAIKATCKGKGCPRALRTAGGRVTGLSGRHLRPGTVITLRLTGAVKRTFTIRIRATRAPAVG